LERLRRLLLQLLQLRRLLLQLLQLPISMRSGRLQMRWKPSAAVKVGSQRFSRLPSVRLPVAFF